MKPPKVLWHYNTSETATTSASPPRPQSKLPSSPLANYTQLALQQNETNQGAGGAEPIPSAGLPTTRKLKFGGATVSETPKPLLRVTADATTELSSLDLGGYALALEGAMAVETMTLSKTPTVRMSPTKAGVRGKPKIRFHLND